MVKTLKRKDRDSNGYRLAPVDVSKTCWLYGGADGLTVIQEERDKSGNHIRTLQSIIPWSAVDKARERK